MNLDKEYCADVNWPTTERRILDAQIVILDWCLKQCNTGMTIPMIKLRIHNKLVEIKGEGEKA